MNAAHRRASQSSHLLLLTASASALLAACTVAEGGNIPCYDDSNCPVSYAQCVGATATSPGTCQDVATLPDGGVSGVALAVVGVPGHKPEDVVSGAVQFVVSARARLGVKSLVVKAGAATLAQAPTSAAPLFVFDVPAQTGQGDLVLQATLTTGDGQAFDAAPYTLHYDDLAPTLTLSTPAPALARRGVLVSVDVTSDEPLASVGGDVFLSGATDTKVGTLSVLSGSGKSFKLGYAVPDDAAGGTYKLTVTGKDAAGNAAPAQTKTAAVYAPFSIGSLVVTSSAAIGGTPAGRPGAAINAVAKLPVAVPVSASGAVFSLIDAAGHSRAFTGTVALTADQTTTTLTVADALSASDADGTAQVKLTLTDAAGNVATSSAALLVDGQAPFVNGLAPSKTVADANAGTVVFSGHASERITAATWTLTAGGTGTGSCTCDGAACASSASAAPLLACTVTVPSVSADTTVSLVVTLTDLVSNGSLAANNTASFQDLAIPVATSLSPATSTITQGGSVTLTPVFTGGVGTLSNNKDASTLAVTSGAAVAVAPLVTTTYTLNVRNALGSPATSPRSAVVTVNPVGFSGALAFDEPVITGGRSGPLGLNVPVLTNVTAAALLDGQGNAAKLANGVAVTSADILSASGAKLSLQAPTSTTSTQAAYTYTLLALSSGAAPASTAAQLSIVPLPAVASGTFAITPNKLTGGANANLGLALPVVTGDTTPKSLTATLQFGASNTDAVNPNTNAAYTSAELLAAAGTTLAVKYPPQSATDDNKTITYSFKVRNASTVPDFAVSSGAVTLYPQPAIDTGTALAFASPQVPGGSSAADALSIPKLTAGTSGSATLQFFDNSAPGVLSSAVCADTAAACTSAQILAASQGTLNVTPPATATSDSKSYTYKLVVTNAAGAASAAVTAPLTVVPRPTITTQPASVTKNQGASATFTVAATTTAGALTYQWRKASANLAGQTGTSLTIASVQSSDAGSYDVVVTNTLAGFTTTTTSAAATLTVNTGVTINTQPASQTVAQGGSASFTVSATNNNGGNGALSYQWKKDGANVVGAASATLNLSNVGAADAGSYLVVITVTLNGSAVDTFSNAAVLTVNLTPTITGQPAAQTIPEGTSVTFTVAATDNNSPPGTLTYQWKKGAGNIGGATSASYTIAAVAQADAGTYSVVVTSNLNATTKTVTSSGAALTVNRAPTIGTQPVSKTIPEGSGVTFTVAATDNNSPAGALSYQWQVGGADIAGATSASYNLAAVAPGDAGSYACVVTSTLNSTQKSVSSSAATLVVNRLPTIATQPLAQTVAQGGSATLSVVVTDNNSPAGVLSYQWKRGTTNVGTNSSFFTIASAVAGDAGSYTCVVTSTLNATQAQVTSSAAALTVNRIPTINTQPVSQTIPEASGVTFTVAATDNNSPAGTLGYQWQKAGVPIGGETSASYSIAAVAPGDAGSYSVVVTSSLGGTSSSATSASATLTINKLPTISTQPVSQTIPQGTGVTFTVVAADNNSPAGVLSYQWKRGATNVGTNAATLTLASVSGADAGSYTCVVTSTLSATQSAATSAAATLVVNLTPSIGTQPASQTIPEGSGVTFAVAATDNNSPAGALTYQWKKGAADVIGANAASYTLPAVAAGDAASYTVVVTSTLNSTQKTVTSSAAVLTVNRLPTLNTQPAAQTIAQGSPVTFTVSATDNNGTATLSYQWQRDATNVGTNSATLTLASVAPSDAGTYTCTVTSTLNSTQSAVTSNGAALTVNLTPNIDTAPTGTNVVQGGSFTLTVAASNNNPSGALTYQWKKGGVNVAADGTHTGGSTASFSVTSAQAADGGSYTVVVTATLNATSASATTGGVTVGVNTPPAITGQPASTTVAQGGTATFTVVANAGTSGGTLSYQWVKGGATNVGTNSATLSLPSVQVADAGSYAVTITNTLGSTTTTTTSNSATLTVSTVPVFNAALTVTPNVFRGGDNPPLVFPLPTATGSPTSVAMTWNTGGASTNVVKSVGGATISVGDLGTNITATGDPNNTTNTTSAPLTWTYSLTATNASGTSTPNTTTVQMLQGKTTLSAVVQRVGASATLLPNGKVLIAGGGSKSASGNCALVTTTSKSAEIYDPSTGATTVPSGTSKTLSVERCQHAAVLVGTQVYFFGGSASSLVVDIYDSGTDSFLTASLPSMAVYRKLPTATLLGAASGTNSGKIVLAGGFTTVHSVILTSMELFDPVAGTSTLYNSTNAKLNGTDGRAEQSATLVGKWLVLIGGQTNSTWGTSSADSFDTTLSPANAVVTSSTPPSNGSLRGAHAAALLSNGTDILLVGGYGNSQTPIKTVQTYTVSATTGLVTAASATVNLASTRAQMPMVATRQTDKFIVIGGIGAYSTGTDTGKNTVELVDASGATIAASSLSNMSVVRGISAAVNLNLGTSNFAFLVAGGDPGGTAAAGTAETLIEP